MADGSDNSRGNAESAASIASRCVLAASCTGDTGNAAAPETGVWAGVKRNTVGMVAGLYHAFTDPATDEEKADLMQKVQDEKAWQKTHGYDPNDVPESLAADPSRITLAYHRLMTLPPIN